MKLCKDCKHFTFPVMEFGRHGPPPTPIYPSPMCGHPQVPRSKVYGGLIIPCSEVRGSGELAVCGESGELFEEKPEPVVERRASWWKRVFGG